jgi:hypothetical protein
MPHPKRTIHSAPLQSFVQRETPRTRVAFEEGLRWRVRQVGRERAGIQKGPLSRRARFAIAAAIERAVNLDRQPRLVDRLT